MLSITMEGVVVTEQTNPTPGSGSPESGQSDPGGTLDEYTQTGEQMQKTRERWGDHAPGQQSKATGPQPGPDSEPAGTEDAQSFPHRESAES
jgi:hypothetical protein